jgi:hypothetical protein
VRLSAVKRQPPARQPHKAVRLEVGWLHYTKPIRTELPGLLHGLACIKRELKFLFGHDKSVTHLAVAYRLESRRVSRGSTANLALAALESWLVRRAILRLTSRNYNRTLPSLLKAIKGDAASADEAMVRELRSSQANTVIWPSDDQIRPRLERGEAYGYIGQPRVRMLLEACELDIRDTSTAWAISHSSHSRSTAPSRTTRGRRPQQTSTASAGS